MSLHGKVALVTGSTAGIGLGIARALGAAGADLVLNGFGEPDALAALTHDLAREHGVRVAHAPADLRRPAEVAAMVAAARREVGDPDILVNNAGIQHVAPVEEFPPEKWDEVIAVNLSACFHAIRLCLPAMKRRGWGRIVNVASVHGLVASAQKSAYVAAKHGLVGLTKTVALEAAQTGVTCNAVCPGWVKTELVARQIAARAEHAGTGLAAAEEALLGEKQPSGQFVTVEQLGAVVAFLCGEAAREIRGAAWTVDGGWSAQ